MFNWTVDVNIKILGKYWVRLVKKYFLAEIMIVTFYYSNFFFLVEVAFHYIVEPPMRHFFKYYIDIMCNLKWYQ